MTYQCINCRTTWETHHHNADNLISHGLCGKCLKEALKPLYRKRQRREGHFDCFGKAECYCDQLKCMYRTVCLEQSITIERIV
jgi:hypothetical protein